MSTVWVRCLAPTLVLACLPFASGAEPVLVSGAVRDARQPQAVVDTDGHVHVVFGSGDKIYYCRSDDGQEFGSPVPLATQGRLSLGMRRGPRVAVTDEAIIVTAILGKQGMGRDGDLFTWRSSDGGISWSDPVQITDSAGAAREGLHGMAADPSGHACCAWLDLRNGQTEIFTATSADHGATWSENRLGYRSPNGSVCECCHPSVAIDQRGVVHLMWRNSLDGARDMYLASSRDGGASFGKARRVGAGSWMLDACPMDGGSLVTGAKGVLTTIWRREGQVFATTGRDREQLLGSGEQPWAASSQDGTYYVWISGRPGELLLMRPDARQATRIADDALDPVIVAGGHDRDAVVVLWETGPRGEAKIMAQLVVRLD